MRASISNKLKVGCFVEKKLSRNFANSLTEGVYLDYDDHTVIANKQFSGKVVRLKTSF